MGVYLGIDLGGTEIKAAILTDRGTTLWTGRVPTRAEEGREAVLGRVADLMAQAREPANGPIQGIGVAVPAVLDMPTGTIELLPNLTPEWKGFRLKDDLQRRSGLPTYLLNDAQAATVAEHTWGGGRGYRNLICVTLGTGVGGGLILDDQLYLGSRGAAGALGHQTMDPTGLPCRCGNIGCLETLASGTALARQAREAIAAGDRELATLAGDEPTPQTLAKSAQDGSDTARAIFARAGTVLGRALANLICVLNPEAIVLGGGVAEAGELLLQPLRQEIERRTIVFPRARGGVEVVVSPLQGKAGAMGAAAWAMRQMGKG